MAATFWPVPKPYQKQKQWQKLAGLLTVSGLALTGCAELSEYLEIPTICRIQHPPHLNTIYQRTYDPCLGLLSEGMARINDGGGFQHPRENNPGSAAGGKWGFINSRNIIVIPPQYDDAEDFSEGLAAFQIKGKWGFINKTNQVVIPPQYDDARSFSEGLAVVQRGDQWVYIDRTGKVILVYTYDTLGRYAPPNFAEGLVAAGQNGKLGFIDKTGTVVIPFRFDPGFYFPEEATFVNGLAAVQLNDKWGYIDRTGKAIIPFQYEATSRRRDGSIQVLSAQGEEFFDKTGKPIIEH